MDKTTSVPILIPYAPEEFWAEMRKIISEELKNIKVPDKPPVNYKIEGLNYKPLFKIEEVCRIFSISRPTIYEWTKDGKLKPFKIRSRVYFLWDDIQRLLSGSTLEK